MKALLLYTVLIVSQSCRSHVLGSEKRSDNKTFKEVEPFTTIILDGEEFSILPEAKHNHSAPPTFIKTGALKKIDKNSHLKISGGINEGAVQSYKKTPALEISKPDSAIEVHGETNSPNQDKKIKSGQKNPEKASKNKKKIEKKHLRREIMVAVKPRDSSSAASWLQTSNPNSNSFPSFQDFKSPGSSQFHQRRHLKYHENNGRPFVNTVSESTETVPSTYTMVFRQADIIQRNLAADLRRRDTDGWSVESESEDTVIAFGSTCDQIQNYTCWIQREIGDVLNLALKINSSKKASSFQIRWMKVFHNFDSGKGIPIEIGTTKLPWNMVSGSDGRELRLNPVTNTDMDPNSIVAKIFLLTKNKGKVLFTLLKKLVFRIDIPIIDMGKIYAGEEISVNMENFVTLPERGNLLFHWNLEVKPHQCVSLPSNIKVSNSGRSVVLKELKKGRLGVLNCVIYSSNRYAVAKRRFNILKIADNVKRRSTAINLNDDEFSRDWIRRRRCGHIIWKNQQRARRRLEEGRRPKSRKKRFKRMETAGGQPNDIDCEPLSRKVYSRWVRSLFRELTTEDPRLMPLEKLFELSEEGDGTLDDIIPHEIHYVNPQVKLLPGTSAERSVGRPNSVNCTKHADCGENAVCIFPDKQSDLIAETGSCNCRQEFYRDGLTCRKIPFSNHRKKRLKRNSPDDFQVSQHLFYDSPREFKKLTLKSATETEFTETPKVLAFEEEESFLLTNCVDDKDCNAHANCIQAGNEHPYCKCKPGFRGNGIFCWEIIDYVPSDQFLPDDESDSKDMSPLPGTRQYHIDLRTPREK